MHFPQFSILNTKWRNPKILSDWVNFWGDWDLPLKFTNSQKILFLKASFTGLTAGCWLVVQAITVGQENINKAQLYCHSPTQQSSSPPISVQIAFPGFVISGLISEHDYIIAAIRRLKNCHLQQQQPVLWVCLPK